LQETADAPVEPNDPVRSRTGPFRVILRRRAACDNDSVTVSFDVEQAGCESCGRVISAALSRVATVESIEIDEHADVATVALSGSVSQNAVESALKEASSRAGHQYRVRSGSWHSRGRESTHSTKR
jgi:copper chaperone CopZ